MLNAKQIAKIQKQVAIKVDAQIKKQDNQLKQQEILRKEVQKKDFETNILPHFLQIRKEITSIKNQSPDKGECFCVWNSKVYVLIDNFVKETQFNQNAIDAQHFDLIKDNQDKKYYQMTKEAFEIETQIYAWITKNFVTLKISITKAKLDTPDLFSLYSLGLLSGEFLEKFPTKTIHDLIAYFNIIDNQLHSLK